MTRTKVATISELIDTLERAEEAGYELDGCAAVLARVSQEGWIRPFIEHRAIDVVATLRAPDRVEGLKLADFSVSHAERGN